VWLVLQPPTLKRVGFGLIPVRSPLLGEYSLFLQVLRCFNSLRALVYGYLIHHTVLMVRMSGLPHSEIRVSSAR
jgi:hypothetical protein